MSKSFNQKLKIIYIRDLLEQTDRDHLLTAEMIREYLRERGIESERKAIYSDIRALTDYGLPIETVAGRNGGFYLRERSFSLPELKLLVDAVEASKFITTNKSRELVRKLEKLAPKKDAKKLNRQLITSRPNKTGNENIYQNVDLIHTAISENRMITFRYFEWTVGKTMRLKRDGMRYRLSPWYLSWDDENYYMIAYDDTENQIKHFRVDKMLEIALQEEKRLGKEKMAELSLGEYVQRTFGMFTGREETVILSGEESLIGVVIDRFGTDISVRPVDEGRFRARVKLAVSPQFFGWLSGFGGKLLVESPLSLREEYKGYIQEILQKYNQD